jgi:hypothetical protein
MHAALRETGEEALSLDAKAASKMADDIMKEAPPELTGPHGGTSRHHAFMLTRLLGPIDNLVDTFRPNAEVDKACTVPLSALDGNATTVQVDSTTLTLRDRIGYMRMKAARTIASGPEEATQPTLQSTMWHPKATSHENRENSRTKTVRNSAKTAHPPKRYSQADSLARSAGHELTADAAGAAVGKAPWPRLEPPPHAQHRERGVEHLTHDSAATLYPREYRLPLPPDFEMPNITHFAFYEHSGQMREAWRRRGYTSASVADRPTQIPPSEDSYHFIGQVFDFVQMTAQYGLRIYAQTNHVECTDSTWACWKLWPEKILDGRMMQAAEEQLWITCIGERSFTEHPHTAHEHLIGPPTQVANANEHGGNDKTWCIWSRNAGILSPTNLVPKHKRTSILSTVEGDRDARMLQRSTTEREMAEAITASIDACHEDDPEPRPSNVPCRRYLQWRQAMHHNFGILAASYAPTLSADDLASLDRTNPLAILIPIAPSEGGAVVMVPLRGQAMFGITLSRTKGYKEQAEEASAFIRAGIETQHMHTMANGNVIVAVPWDSTPNTWIRSPEDMRNATASDAPAVWATTHALSGTPSLEAAMFAVQRLTAMGGPVTHDGLNVGVWDRARPVILRQNARRYGTLPPDPQSERQWARFLQLEADRGDTMRRDLIAADRGSGLIAGITADVRTAADYAAELPIPPQGLPTFDDPSLLMVRAPERPLPLHTDWLHKLPPQQVPAGFTSISYQDALRRWARRMTADNKNGNMRFDAYCLAHGHAPADFARPDDVVLGRGAGKLLPFQDGIGTFNALDIMLETGPDGRLYPADFEKPERRVWIFKAIERYIGATTNQEIMSFFFHGVRWKIKADTQIRLLHNLRRLDTRIAKVNTKLRELTAKGYISAHPICKVASGITEDGPNPFLYLFEWDCGLGGTDKPGQPDKARVIGDMSAPRGLRERNQPDGEPDGPEVISFNDLSGPKGGVGPGFQGYAPFPHPETKPRPRDKYTATAYLSYYAHLNGTFCVTLDDDQVDCFFQYFVADEDLRLCRWNIVDEVEGEAWYIAYRVYTMNQGGRNSSKIACDGNEEWLDAWRRQVDAYVTDWLPKQTKALQLAYKARETKLGFNQARPYWAALYTDNFDFTFCASDLAAAATYIWRTMNGEANMRMQPHVAYGTCTDWIGGRYVLTGGFGCVTPSKRERAILNIERSLEGSLSRELYEKNNSFLVHVADICDWPTESLRGIYAPLKVPGFDEDCVTLTPMASTRLRAVLNLLRTRPLASFWAGVADAYFKWAGAGGSLQPIRTHAFDTCTDPQPTPTNPNPTPHVAGMVDGLWWRFALTGEWLDRHITLTEAIGPAIGALVGVPRFPHDINVLASDATAAAAAGIDTARAEDLLAMRMTLKDEPRYRENEASMWHTHWKGWGNGITDTLSRDDIDMAMRIAKAFGIKLVEIDISNDLTVNRFLRRTLVRTRPTPEGAFPITISGINGTTAMVQVAATTTVNTALEQYLAEINAINADCYITVEGRITNGDATMAQLGVTAGSTLRTVLRARAGMREVSEPPSPLRTRDTPSPSDGRTSEPAPPGHPTQGATQRLPSPRSPSPRSPNTGDAQGGAETDKAAGLLDSVPPSPERQDPILGPYETPLRQPTLTRVTEDPQPSAPTAARPGSPQPLCAHTARKAAARHTADRLTENTTEYALCRDNPAMLRGFLMGIADAKTRGIPKGSAAADEWGWKWARAFGADTNTRWMTPRIGSSDIDPTTERWRTAVCLFWIAQHMSASARRQRLGFEKAKPTSPLLAVYGWRRVLRDCDRYLSDMTHVRALLKGLCALVKQVYGPDAFAVHQARILSNAALHSITRTLANDLMPGWDPALTAAWSALHPFLTATGTRNEEVTRAHPGDDVLLRANFAWIGTDGEPLSMTSDVIRSRRNGDLLRGTPACSKCDRLGITWSKQKQFFRLDDTDELNFAHAMQRYELSYPCPEALRSEWPAFSPTGDERCFTTSDTARTHKRLAIRALGAAGAEDVTIHSYRGTLVSAMYVAKATGHAQFSEGVMQAHVRHKTLDAMYGYGKMMPGAFADNVAVITRTDASKARRDRLPEYGPAGAVASVEAIIDELETEAGSSRTRHTAPAAPSAARPGTTAHAEDHTTGRQLIDVVGQDEPTTAHTHDSWGIVGSAVDLPNALWEEEEKGHSSCRVTHFLHRHAFPDGNTYTAYAVTVDGYEGVYAVRSSTIARHVNHATRARLRKLPPPRPVRPTPTPPPSPPPSPAGGDTFGTKGRRRSPGWGPGDRMTRERARREKWRKLARAFERKAMRAKHPQECPICMDAEQTHLLIDCGNTDVPYHRGHGLCEECASTIIDTTGTCPLCNLPVHTYMFVGTAFFA